MATTTTTNREHYLEINGKAASDKEYKRIVNAKGQDTSTRRNNATLNGNRGFSLMR